MIKRLFLIIALVLMWGVGYSATYYMRADGTAANKAAASGPCGTQANCMSIATHDADTYSAGDTIILCDDGGTYRDQMDLPSSGSDGSPITYEAASGDSPVISGADLVSTWEELTPTDVMDQSAISTSANLQENNRIVIDAADISADATRIRVLFEAGDTAALQINGASICERDADEDCNDTPIRLTFSSGNTKTVAQSGEEWSDYVDVTGFSGGKLDSTKDYLVHIYTDTISENTHYKTEVDHTHWYRQDTSGDLTMTADISLSGTSNSYAAVAKIQDQFSGDVWEATLATAPDIVWMNGTAGTEETGTCPDDLDTDTEWCHDSGTLYQNSTSDPDTRYTSPGTEASQRDNCIVNDSSADYITITGLSLKHAEDYALESNENDSWIIYSNTFANNYRHLFFSGDSAGSALASGLEIYSNTFGYTDIAQSADSQYSAIRIEGTDSAKIYQNTFNTTNSIALRLFSGGSYLTTTGAEIYENAFTNNHANILFISDVDDSFIYRNHIYDSRGYGIALQYGSDDNAVYYNLIHDLETSSEGYNGIDINANSDDNLIYGNTVFKVSTVSLTVEDYDGSSDGTIIKNNILDATENNPADVPIMIEDTVTSLTMSNNNLWPNPSHQSGAVGRFKVDSGDEYKESIAVWMSEVSDDAGFDSSNEISSDPLFTDKDNDDFILQVGSPELNAGTDLGDTYDDALDPGSVWPDAVLTMDQDDYGGGFPSGSGWEIGAYGSLGYVGGIRRSSSTTFEGSTVGYIADIRNKGGAEECTATGTLFYWFAENTTIGSGFPKGCSMGDTTAAANDSITLSSTQNRSHNGTNSAYAADGDKYYTFVGSSEDIFHVDAGSLIIYVYITTWVDAARLFSFYGSDDGANNYISFRMDGDGTTGNRDVTIVWNGQGNGVSGASDSTDLTLNTWQGIKFEWDISENPDWKISFDTNNDGSFTGAETGNMDPTDIAANDKADFILNIGESGSKESAYYIDDIQVLDTESL